MVLGNADGLQPAVTGKIAALIDARCSLAQAAAAHQALDARGLVGKTVLVP